MTFSDIYFASAVIVAIVGAVAWWIEGDGFIGLLWLVLIPLSSYTFYWTAVLTFRVMQAAFFG